MLTQERPSLLPQSALVAMAAMMVLMVPIGVFLHRAMGPPIHAADHEQQTLTGALREARSHSGYLLLILGFFVCGFQVQFVATHLPAYIADSGLSERIGALSLTVIAFSNMFGAALAGGPVDESVGQAVSDQVEVR